MQRNPYYSLLTEENKNKQQNNQSQETPPYKTCPNSLSVQTLLYPFYLQVNISL